MQDFENRLIKNYKHIGKWARRQGISCFRIFDFELPSYPFCIDKYGEYFHIVIYKTKHSLSPEEESARTLASLKVISQAFGVPENHLFIKQRERQEGTDQYNKLGEESFGFWADEYGVKLWVNLSDYLDTGLFLDHRVARKWVREESDGRNVLNLFSYTGAFSVQAAMGGATSVDTVDMSNAYLDWAKKNMEANGFSDETRFRYLRKDILAWLAEKPERKYDIIILDPPTFSNSKKMKEILDIQRDHVRLIRQSMERLASGGVLYFSNNLRNFKIDIESLSDLNVKDVSAASIPNDFRNKNIHKCFKISG